MDDEAAWRKLGAQVLWYRRDTHASRLKLLAISQLVRIVARGRQQPQPRCTPHPSHPTPRLCQLLGGSYAVGPRSLPCGGFGVLCGCGALLGLAAAHSCSRSLLRLVRCAATTHRPAPVAHRTHRHARPSTL